MKIYIEDENKHFTQEFDQYKEDIKTVTVLYTLTTSELMEMIKRYQYWLERCPKSWWLKNLDRYPKMGKAVLFNIRVSIAESERGHSAIKLILKPQRSSLSPELCYMMRFIQQNLPFFYPHLFGDESTFFF